MRFAFLALGLVVLSMGARAHHSFAEYDRESIHEIEGELIDVRWRNPHVMFTVRAVGSDGQTEDWELESAAVYVVERSGLEESTFDGADYVRAAGWRSPDSPAMRVTNILLPSGQELLMTGVVGNRWSDDFTGGELVGDRVDRADRDLYRIWSIEDIGRYSQSVEQSDVQLTAEARSRMSAPVEFDPCEPQGMPSIMQNPLPVEFIDRGDTIDLRLSSFGVVRTIHMNGEPSSDAIPASDLGYSIGRRVGDTLEVRTTRVSWPYLDDTGTPQTEGVDVFERFSLVDNKTRLTYNQTVTDPASFLAPVTASWDWADIGEEQVAITRCE